MLEGVMREHGMADFDVELDLALEAEAPQEPGHRRDVEIVLMLGRLLRLRLDQQNPLEADLVLVVDDQRQESPELLQLAGKIGVEQGLVSFAAAPQHVILAAELVRRIDGVLHLRGGVGEHVGIGIGRRARHVTRMAEEVGGAPQELDPGRAHLVREQVGHLGEVASEFGEVRALRNDVLVVEGEEREAERRDHVEGDVGLEPRRLHVVPLPRALEGRRAEHVGAHPGEVVPVADGGPQLLGHRLAHHHAGRIVMAEGEGIVARRPLEAHRADVAEKPIAHLLLPTFGRFHEIRKSRTKRVSAASPKAQSSSVIDSSGLWLTPPLQRTNSMPAGQSAPIDHRIVPRPRRQQPGRDAERFDRLRQSRHDVLIADEGARLVRLGDGRAHAARSGDRIDARREVGERGRAARVVRRAKVDGKLHVARNDVGRARPDFEAPDGGDEMGLGAGARFDGERHLGGRRQGVAAEVHRRRPGVARDAVDADLEPRCAVDGGDDAERQPFSFQDRALLDMRLDEGCDICRADRCAPCPDRRRRRLSASRIVTPFASLWSSSLFRVVPGERARAGEGRAVAHAFLVAEGDDFECVLQPLAARREQFSTTASAASAP